MKNLILTLSIILTLSLSIQAQNEVDALRYSQTSLAGTARYVSMGGAFGALGADFSTLSSNPAGIGLYKKSEFTFSPSYYIGSTKSEYYGKSISDNQHNFNLGNVGIIVSNETGNGVISNFQYGFGLNRINNFNNRMLVKGYNNSSSIIDTYVNDANGIYYDELYYYPYDLEPAWQTYLIDTIEGFENQYLGAIPPGGNVLQRKDIYTWGSMNEMVFSLGANIGDKVYIGGTFGFPFIRYFEESTYVEEDEQNMHNGFRSLQLTQSLKTNGSGFNIKFGTIIRATNWLRIGGAIHSPTWYNNMRDNWWSDLSAEYDNGEYYTNRSPNGNYNYELNTPWKAIGSAAVILGRFLIVSAEYEYIDYTSAKLRARDYNFYDENNAIRDKYSVTQNIKLGSEFRIENFALRAGYSIYGSPFKESINDAERTNYSAGFGFRDKNYFIDFGYVLSISNEDYYLYGSENVVVDPVKTERMASNFVVTLGLRY
jgi:hypothetical protein